MALSFERRGATWTVSDDRWEVMLIARDVYYGTERLVVTLTAVREIPYAPRQLILTERLDLMGALKRKHFAHEASERLGKKDVEGRAAGILTLVETFLEHLQQVHGEIEDEGLTEIAVPDDMTPQYAIWPLVPSSRPGMLVSPSGSGKSTLAGAVGLSVSTGQPILGRLEPRTEGPVLYIGQEETKEQWAARILQLCRGHGITPPEHYRYMRLAGSSLVESAEKVAEKARGMKAALVIVDSAQATWGAESDNVRGWATQWFNAVDLLETPTLIIDHPNRAESQKRGDDGFAAGSSVKRDRVGHSWSMRSAEVLAKLGEPKRYLVTLRDTKRNYVARQPDIAYETQIKGYEWIRLNDIDAPIRLDESAASEGSHMLRRLLVENSDEDASRSATEVAAAWGLKDTKMIRAELRNPEWRFLPDFNADKEFRFERVDGTGIRGIEARYVLKLRPHAVQFQLLNGGLSDEDDPHD